LQKVKVHIISFDVPYPADYGGVIDVFFKVKALSEAGCEIYLHCFQYGREKAPLLAEYCKEVYYYERKTGLRGFSFVIPYIIASRSSSKLLIRLAENIAPVLFEGVHSCYSLNHKALEQRVKLIRSHNIEHDYYRQLKKREGSWLRNLYFRFEAYLLSKYERSLNNANAFIALSENDKEFWRDAYPNKKVEFIPPFHPFQYSDIPTGKGSYCLYHGNLNHPENEEAALFLLNEVIPKVNIDFIIAGRKATARVRELATRLNHCSLMENLSENEMKNLIGGAQINVLPTFQISGMKLKFIYSLFHGRHIIANDAMMSGTGLDRLCNLAENPDEFIQQINRLKDLPFTDGDKEMRIQALRTNYDTKKNAEKIITYLQEKLP
jgi:hypothetical protein